MPAIADSTLAALPTAVRSFVQRHDIPASSIRPDGRVVLTVDRRYRVQLVPAPHQRVALQAELVPLADHADTRTGDLLVRLAKAASGLLQRHASTLCIDRKRQSLVLQQSVPAAADLQSLQEAMADFVNALAFWQRLCAAELAAPRGTDA